MSDSLTVELPATSPTSPPTAAARTAPTPPASPATPPSAAADIGSAPESDAPGEPSRSRDRTPGWREVLVIAAIVVVAVLAIQVVTSNLPVSVQNLLFNTPLVIVVLVGGTVGLLVRITRRSST